MLPCPGCSRFVRTDAGRCPFCDALVRHAPSPAMPAVASILLGLTLTACGGDSTGDDAADDAPNPTTTSMTSTMTGTSTGNDSFMGDTFGGEAYAGPDVDTTATPDSVGSTTETESSSGDTGSGSGSDSGSGSGSGSSG